MSRQNERSFLSGAALARRKAPRSPSGRVIFADARPQCIHFRGCVGRWISIGTLVWARQGSYTCTGDSRGARGSRSRGSLTLNGEILDSVALGRHRSNPCDSSRVQSTVSLAVPQVRCPHGRSIASVRGCSAGHHAPGNRKAWARIKALTRVCPRIVSCCRTRSTTSCMSSGTGQKPVSVHAGPKRETAPGEIDVGRRITVAKP